MVKMKGEEMGWWYWMESMCMIAEFLFLSWW